MSKIGYKAFELVDGKLVCRDMVYKEGGTYEVQGNIKLCGTGIHYCKKIEDIRKKYKKVIFGSWVY